MFFLAFLPQFVSGNSEQVAWQMLLLGGIFMAMTLVVFIGYGLFAAALRDHVITRPRIMTWIRRVYAGAFVAMGLKLAMAER